MGSGSMYHCKTEFYENTVPVREYFIEALGGDVGRTVTKYLHQELQWIEDGNLPEHFMLVGGVLS